MTNSPESWHSQTKNSLLSPQPVGLPARCAGTCTLQMAEAREDVLLVTKPGNKTQRKLTCTDSYSQAMGLLGSQTNFQEGLCTIHSVPCGTEIFLRLVGDQVPTGPPRDRLVVPQEHS